MRARLLALRAAAIAAGSLAPGLVARADDAPAAGAASAPPRAKVSHPYLDSLVGSWDIVSRPEGLPEVKGTARWWKALGDTALVEEMAAGEGEHAFFGFGILYVGADGTSLDRWWFDSMGQGNVWHTKGTLAADGWVLSSGKGAAQIDNLMKKSGDGHAYTMKTGDKVNVAVSYQKAAKEAPPPPLVAALSIKQPLVLATLGDYTVKGEFKTTDNASAYEGKASIRLGVGGAYSIMDFEVTGAWGHVPSLSVDSVSADGKALQGWGFSSFGDRPVAVAGTFFDTGWTGKAATTSLGGPFDMTWTKTATGFEMKAAYPGGESMTETYTRKK